MSSPITGRVRVHLVIVSNESSSKYETEVATVFDEERSRRGHGGQGKANGHAGAHAMAVEADGGTAATAAVSAKSPIAALRNLLCCCLPKPSKPSSKYELLQEFDEL